MQIAKRIDPTEYILSVISQQERLEITFRIAQEAFKETTLTLQDIEAAVKRIRRRAYEESKKTKGSS